VSDELWLTKRQLSDRLGIDLEDLNGVPWRSFKKRIPPLLGEPGAVLEPTFLAEPVEIWLAEQTEETLKRMRGIMDVVPEGFDDETKAP